MRRRAFSGLLSIGLAVAVAAPWAWAQHGAKGIFYSGEGPTVRTDQPAKGAAGSPPSVASPAPAPSVAKPQATKPQVAKEVGKEPYIALSYWVELVERDGQKRRVTTERTFRSGERIRLRMVSNRDGYLYLLNIGTTGRSTLLFPNAGIAGGKSWIKANTPYEIPYSASIRFDDNPGIETLLLMLSSKPVEEAMLTPGPQARSLTVEETRRVTVTAQQKGAKDLVLEEDSASPEPASYAAVPLASLEGEQMITLQIKLRHE